MEKENKNDCKPQIENNSARRRIKDYLPEGFRRWKPLRSLDGVLLPGENSIGDLETEEQISS